MTIVGIEREPPASLLEGTESAEHTGVLKFLSEKRGLKNLLDLPEQGKGETPSPRPQEMMECQLGSVPWGCFSTTVHLFTAPDPRFPNPHWVLLRMLQPFMQQLSSAALISAAVVWLLVLSTWTL